MTQPPDCCSKIHCAWHWSGSIYVTYYDKPYRLVFPLERLESPHAGVVAFTHIEHLREHGVCDGVNALVHWHLGKDRFRLGGTAT